MAGLGFHKYTTQSQSAMVYLFQEQKCPITWRLTRVLFSWSVSGVQARRPPSLCQRAPPPFLLDSSLHSTHLCTHSSLHSTHLYTYSSLHSTHLCTHSSLHSTHLYTYSSLHSTHLCTHSSLHSTHLYTYSSLHSTHLCTHSSLHSTHLYTHSSLHSTHLCTHSSLHSTHLYTHSSLHSTHLCTYSSLSAVPNVWTIYAPQPRLSACRDYLYPHSHVHVCMFTIFPVWPITFGFVHSGHQHFVAIWGVPLLIIVLFLPVGFWFNKEKKLTCIWTQISYFFHAASWQSCDLNMSAPMRWPTPHTVNKTKQKSIINSINVLLVFIIQFFYFLLLLLL